MEEKEGIIFGGLPRAGEAVRQLTTPCYYLPAEAVLFVSLADV